MSSHRGEPRSRPIWMCDISACGDAFTLRVAWAGLRIQITRGGRIARSGSGGAPLHASRMCAYRDRPFASCRPTGEDGAVCPNPANGSSRGLRAVIEGGDRERVRGRCAVYLLVGRVVRPRYRAPPSAARPAWRSPLSPGAPSAAVRQGMHACGEPLCARSAVPRLPTQAGLVCPRGCADREGYLYNERFVALPRLEARWEGVWSVTAWRSDHGHAWSATTQLSTHEVHAPTCDHPHACVSTLLPSACEAHQLMRTWGALDRSSPGTHGV